jgi:hypothetical protein
MISKENQKRQMNYHKQTSTLQLISSLNQQGQTIFLLHLGVGTNTHKRDQPLKVYGIDKSRIHLIDPEDRSIKPRPEDDITRRDYLSLKPPIPSDKNQWTAGSDERLTCLNLPGPWHTTA